MSHPHKNTSVLYFRNAVTAPKICPDVLCVLFIFGANRMIPYHVTRNGIRGVFWRLLLLWEPIPASGAWSGALIFNGSCSDGIGAGGKTRSFNESMNYFI